MKLVLFADVHGNLPALQAVMQAEKEADVWICAGDLVGYYLQPEEVCSTVRSLGACTIRGNHDSYVADKSGLFTDLSSDYRIEYCQSMLTHANMCWLRTLPASVVFNLDGLRVIVHHASPWDETTYIYPDSSDLIARISLNDNEVMVLAHTHHPMLVRAGRGWLLNPGSVGQPRDRLPGAAYAVIDTETRGIVHKRALYDMTAYAVELRAAGISPRMVCYFESGSV